MVPYLFDYKTGVMVLNMGAARSTFYDTQLVSYSLRCFMVFSPEIIRIFMSVLS